MNQFESEMLKCSRQVMFLLFRTSDEEVQLRGELKRLRRELASVSPVDEFARYARLQRKINKIEEQVMSKGQSRMDVRESLRWKSTKAVQALIVINNLFGESWLVIN